MHATTKANSLKFRYILENYGAISISIAPFSKYGESLQKAEGQLLWWYFQNHCEPGTAAVNPLCSQTLDEK
jgi:hypothetical protein